MAACRNHPDRETPERCAGCGTSYCDGCLVRFEKLLLCEGCKARFLADVDVAPRSTASARDGSARRAPSPSSTTPGSVMPWVLGGAALLFAGLFTVVIIASIAEPWTALRKDRRVGAAADRLVQVGAALERYRIDKGAYPETLEALVPTYLAKLPEDPYTGRPLQYDGASRVWSAGADGKDEGGEPPGDLRYEVVAP